MKIVLCSSASFYKHVNELADQLDAAGYEAVMPKNARKMRKTDDYDVAKSKTWYDNPEDFVKKRAYVDAHFAEIEQGDAVLIVNDKKHGIEGYIGPNVLMEMALAYYLGKKMYVLNTVTKENTVYEEVLGLGCEQLDGDIQNLKA